MKLAGVFLIFAAGLTAQTSQSAIVSTAQTFFSVAKNDVLKSADKIPDNLWSYRPTPEIRTLAQLFAHIADGQYEFCGPAKGETLNTTIEKTAETKAEIVAALKDAFSYCDAVLAKMTPATAVETVTFFGRPMTRIGIMDFNTAHTMEHYGNLVTYMRLKGIVPPSSEAQK